MIGKPSTIGRTVVTLSDLNIQPGHDGGDNAVEKIVSIHKYKETKNVGLCSGQGYDNICSTWRTKFDSCVFSCCRWHKSHEN